IINWLFLGRRGALACVALLAAVFLGQAKGPCRRYLLCWSCVGIFAAGPNTMAYIKIMGLPNNLCLFEIWMFLLVWPVIVMFPQLFPQLISVQTSTPTGWKPRAITAVLYLGVIVYAVALLPLKRIPSASEYDFGREVEAGVRRDLQAGRKVLVSHGAACLVHCGITEPPLDRCNSALEIFTGNKPELLSGLKARIAAHHYDRIYLTLGSYYGPDVLDEIHKNYEVETVIPKIRPPKGFFTLRGAVMKECTEYAVLKPK
ncbi:MAG TPA: hypothetical protein VG754_02955, partial [Verrucomicrobiae bacterium]|nr:hypothetical protein [Verrucomicrobiae bacterium]